MPWMYKGSTEFVPPEGAVGFVYRILEYHSEAEVSLVHRKVGIWPCKKLYIGKKLLQTNRKGKIGVREKKATWYQKECQESYKR